MSHRNASLRWLAGALLATSASRLEPSELDYVLAAGLTGALAAGDRAAAAGLAGRFAELYPRGIEPPFYLRIPLAALEAGVPAGMPQSM